MRPKFALLQSLDQFLKRKRLNHHLYTGNTPSVAIVYYADKHNKHRMWKSNFSNILENIRPAACERKQQQWSLSNEAFDKHYLQVLYVIPALCFP